MFKLKGICCKVGNIDDGQTRLGALLQSLLVNFALAEQKNTSNMVIFPVQIFYSGGINVDRERPLCNKDDQHSIWTF